MKKKPFLYHVVDLINLISGKAYNFYLVKSNKVIYGKNLVIHGKIWIKPNHEGVIRLGDNVTINSGYRNNPIGAFDRTTLWTQGQGKIIIGNNVGISNTALVSANEIIIEDNVLIGGGTRIYDTDFHSLQLSERLKYENDRGIKAAAVKIGKGAFIGAGVTILKGVEIGECSIIGAASVITKNVPPYEIWAGNPAKFIKKVSST